MNERTCSNRPAFRPNPAISTPQPFLAEASTNTRRIAPIPQSIEMRGFLRSATGSSAQRLLIIWWYDYRANTNRKNSKATERHLAEVKQDQAYGIILGDGVTLASIE